MQNKRWSIMRTLSLPLFLPSCCIFLLLVNGIEANQADQLRRLIEMQHLPMSSFKYNSWPEEDSGETFSTYYLSPQDGLREADKITELPGQPNGVDFDQYAGYVTVDQKNGRALFYYFVESPHQASERPLVLWLNGGPGCSSLGFGAMEEIGPFRVNSDGRTLSRNKYAWNRVANVIFLESPAGVGFSYSNTTTDYHKSGDKRTAEDSYTFLLNWLDRFPQYKSRDFFITGESYAGHYIPQLAYTILQNNKITNRTVINLRGVAIGNAYVDAVSNQIGRYEYLWSHAIISDNSYAAIRKHCNFYSRNFSEECRIAQDNVGDEVGFIDLYNIYAPLCLEPSNSPRSGVSMARFDPCSDDYVSAYLNNHAVQKALHANSTSLSYPWQSCTEIIVPWNDQPPTMLPTFKHLISSNLSVLLYSGDLDSIVPLAATKAFIKMLHLPLKNSWRPWYLNNEVGGYVEGYNGLTFVTIRAAGHTVPSYQPKRSLTMISSFLQGKLPPSLSPGMKK